MSRCLPSWRPRSMTSTSSRKTSTTTYKLTRSVLPSIESSLQHLAVHACVSVSLTLFCPALLHLPRSCSTDSEQTIASSKLSVATKAATDTTPPSWLSGTPKTSQAPLGKIVRLAHVCCARCRACWHACCHGCCSATFELSILPLRVTLARASVLHLDCGPLELISRCLSDLRRFVWRWI